MERLSHLFDSAAKLDSLPSEFKCAQFSKIVVKVTSCGLHSTDQIIKHGMLSHLRYPITPGSMVTGKVVQMGQNVKHMKLGYQVVGVAAHGGLAEYAVLNADYACELKKKEGATQQAFAEVFEGARCEAELRRFEHEQKSLSKDEHRRVANANERLGFHGEGVDVVIGHGGSARVAVQVLKHASTRKDQRVIVVTSNDRFNHTFYDVEEADHLLLSHNEVGSALKAIGGIRFAIAACQPSDAGFEQILEAMRYASELVVLAPRHEMKLQIPLAPVVSKALSIRGAIWPDRVALDKVVEMVHERALHVSVNLYKFSPEDVNKAWNDLEEETKFDQPVVVVEETIQAHSV
ncbi:hypothetical protein JCM3766R1_001104 [Sporobolomyces carnicolor]